MANKLRIIQCLISGHKYEKVDLERYKGKLFIGGFETKEGKIPNLEECVRCGEGRYPIYPWNWPHYWQMSLC